MKFLQALSNLCGLGLVAVAAMAVLGLNRWVEFLGDYLAAVPPLPARFRWLHRTLLGSVMLVAFSLPAINARHANYNYDQQRDFCRTVSVAHGRVSPWTVQGPAGINEWPTIRSSSQMPYLLWALPVRLWADQRVGFIVSGILGAVTLWAVTRASFGQFPMGMLWLVAFFAFLRFRELGGMPFYHPSLTIPFSALTLYALNRFWISRGIGDFLLVLLTAGIGAQVHIGNVVSLNGVFLSLRWVPAHRRRVWLLGALFGLGVLFIPYIWSRLASGEVHPGVARWTAGSLALAGFVLFLAGIVGSGSRWTVLRESAPAFLATWSALSVVLVVIGALLSGRHGFERYFEQARLPFLLSLVAFLHQISGLRGRLRGWGLVLFVAGWYQAGMWVTDDVANRREPSSTNGIFAAIRFLETQHVTQADFLRRTHWLSHRRTDFSLLSFVPRFRSDLSENAAAELVRVVMRTRLASRLPYHPHGETRIPDTDLDLWSFRSAIVEGSLAVRRADGAEPLPSAFWDEMNHDDLVTAYPGVFEGTFVAREVFQPNHLRIPFIRADPEIDFRIRDSPNGALLCVVTPSQCGPTVRRGNQVLALTAQTPTENGEETTLWMFKLAHDPADPESSVVLRCGACDVSIFDIFAIAGDDLD